MPTSLHLSSEIEQRLEFLASNTGRTAEDCIQEIVERGLTDLEDYYFATEVLDQVRAGQESGNSRAQQRRQVLDEPRRIYPLQKTLF